MSRPRSLTGGWRPDSEPSSPRSAATATINGRPVQMVRAATLRKGRTIVPVRFFAEATGAAIDWDGSTKVARLNTHRLVRSARAEQ